MPGRPVRDADRAFADCYLSIHGPGANLTLSRDKKESPKITWNLPSWVNSSGSYALRSVSAIPGAAQPSCLSILSRDLKARRPNEFSGAHGFHFPLGGVGVNIRSVGVLLH